MANVDSSLLKDTSISRNHNRISNSPETIPRSSLLNKLLFVARAKSPSYLYQGRRLIHPISQNKRDIVAIRRNMLDNSSTFALAIQTMEDCIEIRNDLTVVHQGFKVVDYLVEKRTLDTKTKRELLSQFFDTTKYPDESGKNVRSLEARLNSLGFLGEKEEEHSSLIKDTPILIRAFQSRPQRVKDSFLQYGEKMAESLTRDEEISIINMGDVDVDCLRNAGYVGYAINDIYLSRGFLSQEEVDNLRTPARTVGKAVQLGNNLRDLFDDPNFGIPHWPKEIMTTILKAPLSEETDLIKSAYQNEFTALVSYTFDKFIKATTEYADELPRGRPYGPRIFTGLSLAAYAAVVRNVDNERFIATQGEYIKPSKLELLDMRDVVTGLAKKNQDFLPFIRHLLIGKTSQTFRNPSYSGFHQNE